MRIVVINSTDGYGGAAGIARGLVDGYRKHGHEVVMLVGAKTGVDDIVQEIDNDRARGIWARSMSRISDKPGGSSFRSKLRWLGQPLRSTSILMGREDFSFPGIEQMLDRGEFQADAIHCHNLHSSYFDLRILPRLSQIAPVFLTLHDAWPLSGHCAHSLSCDRWKTGCGNCPDLTLSPAIRRDATAFNWRRKRDIYSRCRLHVATPSRWLSRRVEQSMLMPAVADLKVIHNGIDLERYCPGDKIQARKRLGLPLDSNVALFAAHNPKTNRWKDYDTIEQAVRMLGNRWAGPELLVVCLGQRCDSKVFGPIELRFVPYEQDVGRVVAWYRAADIYLHSANVDTFPNSVIEAFACGCPVVATAVGGIVEQVVGLKSNHDDPLNHADRDRANGILVPPHDAPSMVSSILTLMNDTELRKTLGANAAIDARSRFDQSVAVSKYLEWIHCQCNHTGAPTSSSLSSTSTCT